MLTVSISLAMVLIGVAMLLNLWRLLRGPDTVDRIMALDTLYVNSVGILVLLGIHEGITSFFEAGLLIAMMGFAGTVALCKYLLRGDIIE